ncbi:MAG: DUF6677 family protein [Phycisphaerales bacterium]
MTTADPARRNDRDTAPIRPEAAILAWIVPGLGHAYLGERLRGLIIFIATTILIGSGVLIGGLDVVDRDHDRLWFIAQSGCGPVVFGLDVARRRLSPAQDYTFDPRSADRQTLEAGDPDMLTALDRASIGHVNEVGTIFIALTGLMNLVVVLDCINPDRFRSRRRGEDRP